LNRLVAVVAENTGREHEVVLSEGSFGAGVLKTTQAHLIIFSPAGLSDAVRSIQTTNLDEIARTVTKGLQVMRHQLQPAVAGKRGVVRVSSVTPIMVQHDSPMEAMSKAEKFEHDGHVSIVKRMAQIGAGAPGTSFCVFSVIVFLTAGICLRHNLKFRKIPDCIRLLYNESDARGSYRFQEIAEEAPVGAMDNRCTADHCDLEDHACSAQTQLVLSPRTSRFGQHNGVTSEERELGRGNYSSYSSGAGSLLMAEWNEVAEEARKDPLCHRIGD